MQLRYSPSTMFETIRTSQVGWLAALARIYTHRRPALLIDDAGLGVAPANQTLFDTKRASGLWTREIAAVCVALGMSAVGIAMIVVAFVNPEQTSKFELMVGGGAVCVVGGSVTAIRISRG